MEQTALQLFVNEMNRRVNILRTEPFGITRDTMIDNLLVDTDTYLQMEKRQTIYAYEHGQNNEFSHKMVGKSHITGEEYYEQTYKTQAQ